ncbi:carbohydrate ABC transporter permease [Peloplasma aerotolerans]|jgi:multiple sugar transport system permease protein|uniref:Carbohydrate ABC transporter permease n=1 Tax=Peloplasma aerotolerans TaxID=3044389 RepID=A0AAW6U2T7_9MOLU|nr:carbohydrate ABC transporter permease [Mariniplasma sp. M4Ah]MDI6452286.1 carbohydrate ABC transporter permease [Mariniplasma sp. M4Ah]MDR4968711.1 carbohydrate ABC transporter permease [Acholeplasmataceae bacterium]
MNQTIHQKPKRTWKTKIRKFILGNTGADSPLAKIIIYILLISIGFLYIYPMLYMLSTSMKSQADIINPIVNWVPTAFYFGNYERAFRVLRFFPTLTGSLVITLVPALIQTLVTSFIGYGFAKFEFKFKKVWLVLVLMTFIIPVQVYMIPRYVMFFEFNLLEKPMAIILPALFGQGVNSAIFVLIFYQFFRMIPKSINEAAEIDGAGPYYIFFRIAVPLAIPAFITSFLFGMVWYWNETYISSLFLGSGYPNLQLRLANFVSEYSQIYASDTLLRINEGVRLAATLLIILPMLIVYFTIQRWFVEGVEKTGVTGE